MNLSDLITMVILILVPAVVAWWWTQKANGTPTYRPGRPKDDGKGDAGLKACIEGLLPSVKFEALGEGKTAWIRLATGHIRGGTSS